MEIVWPEASPAIRQVLLGLPSCIWVASYATRLPSKSVVGGAVSGTVKVAPVASCIRLPTPVGTSAAPAPSSTPPIPRRGRRRRTRWRRGRWRCRRRGRCRSVQQDEDEPDQECGPDHPRDPRASLERVVALGVVDLLVGEQLLARVPVRLRADLRRRCVGEPALTATGVAARHGGRVRGLHRQGDRLGRCLGAVGGGGGCLGTSCSTVAVSTGGGGAGAGSPMRCPQLRQNRPTPSSAPHRTHVSTRPR